MSTIEIKKKATSLRIDNELYLYIEKLAKEENRSVNNFIETTLSEAIKYRVPNAETIRAIEEMRKEKASLKRYSNVDDLMKDLED